MSIHYNSYFEGENVSYDSTYMRGKPTVFTLSNNEVLHSIDYAVSTMKLHEESHFIISWQWLYGEHGCPPRIKPKADALFVIRLIDFKEVSMPLLNDPDGEITSFYKKLQEAAKYDSAAKAAFKNNNMGAAIQNYKRAINEIDKCPLKDANEESVHSDFLKKIFLNLAICYNNENMSKKACSMINNLKTLNGLDGNAKALYQQGKALMDLGKYSCARKAFCKAKELVVHDVNIVKAMKELDERIAKYNEEEKRLAQNALGMILHSKEHVDIHPGSETKVSNKSVEKIEEFLKSNTQTLLLPNDLSKEEISALRAMEKTMRFKLIITETMSASKQLKLVKLT